MNKITWIESHQKKTELDDLHYEALIRFLSRFHGDNNLVGILVLNDFERMQPILKGFIKYLFDTKGQDSLLYKKVDLRILHTAIKEHYKNNLCQL